MAVENVAQFVAAMAAFERYVRAEQAAGRVAAATADALVLTHGAAMIAGLGVALRAQRDEWAQLVGRTMAGTEAGDQFYMDAVMSDLRRFAEEWPQPKRFERAAVGIAAASQN